MSFPDNPAGWSAGRISSTDGVEEIHLYEKGGCRVIYGRRNKKTGMIELDPTGDTPNQACGLVEGRYIYRLGFYLGEGDWDYYLVSSLRILTRNEVLSIRRGGDALSPTEYLERRPIPGVTFCPDGGLRDPFWL